MGSTVPAVDPESTVETTVAGIDGTTTGAAAARRPTVSAMHADPMHADPAHTDQERSWSPLIADSIGRRYRRGRPWALRDVSLEIPRGSITALVGPNGAGKSTLIRACLGFERLDEGRLTVNGIDPQRDRSAAVASVGYVPQRGSLYQNLTIADHMTLAATARPAFDAGRSIERLRGLGLGDQRSVGELSGGEQAQVALALALGTGASLLLLVEPLSSLDPLARRDFLATLIEDVRGRGATAVLSSHIVTDVEQACDRLVVLAAGRVVLEGTVAEARARHRTVAARDADAMDVVGRFGGPAGEQLALVRGAGAGATLEEIILGYLASARAGQLAEAA
jgi:ABC-2 type transport system ATP-binding protein